MTPFMYSEMQNKLSKTRESPLESMEQIISSRCPYEVFSHFGGHLQFQIRTGAVKRPPCSIFALLNDHFQFLWSFNVNLNSNLRNIFMIILYFLDLPVEILKFRFFYL